MVIGILPAAGRAARFYGMEKMLLPLPNGFSLLGQHIGMMERVTGRPFIRIGIADHNRDLVQHLDSRVMPVLVGNTITMAHTVLNMRELAEDHDIILGMPDSYIEDGEVHRKTSDALETFPDCEIVLAIFSVRKDQYKEGGMVRVKPLVENVFQVEEIIDKPTQDENFCYIWGAMAWRVSFWKHIDLHDPHTGFSAQRAIDKGCNVKAVLMDGGFWDCGTPERYFALIRHLTEER